MQCENIASVTRRWRSGAWMKTVARFPKGSEKSSKTFENWKSFSRLLRWHLQPVVGRCMRWPAGGPCTPVLPGEITQESRRPRSSLLYTRAPGTVVKGGKVPDFGVRPCSADGDAAMAGPAAMSHTTAGRGRAAKVGRRGKRRMQKYRLRHAPVAIGSPGENGRPAPGRERKLFENLRKS